MKICLIFTIFLQTAGSLQAVGRHRRQRSKYSIRFVSCLSAGWFCDHAFQLWVLLSPLSESLCPPLQEQQLVVCQMLQQQRQRELQRLTLTGALGSTPSSPMVAPSPGLLSSASPLQGGQGGGLFLQENALHKPAVSLQVRMTRRTKKHSLYPFVFLEDSDSVVKSFVRFDLIYFKH